MGRPRRVWAPSDVAEQATPERVNVGGRVVRTEPAGCELADATCRISVELAEPAQLGVGDLLVVAARRVGTRLAEARVLEVHPAPEPRADGEHGRLGWQGVGRRLVLRARALDTIRAYFRRQRFTEVDTPLRVPAPGLDLHLDAIPAQDGWLITSPEHHMKRLLVGGMPRIFQLTHVSRADELGALHEPEFMMLEWYRAFADSAAVMADTEQLVSRVVKALSGGDSISSGGRKIDVSPPYERLPIREAFRRYAGESDAVALAQRDAEAFFELLVGKVEPALARHDRPVFLCDYPLDQASLARAAPHDGSVAERFELYVAGVELCNGFGELTDPVEQRRRFRADLARRKQTGRPEYPLDERLLAALHEGMPPSGGNALGVDRLVALATGATGVADVQAFPAARL